jgi:hypothetical protein
MQTLAAALVLGLAPSGGSAQELPPHPVRNDVAQSGLEFLVLRHQRLVKGSHERYYEVSRDLVWPWYEKIGVRVVGQWQVIFPEGVGGSDESDDAYRLARYRSFKHWAATRRSDLLGGNGPDFLEAMRGQRARDEVQLSSRGGVFLEGFMAPGEPHYSPGLDEQYRRIGDPEAPIEAGAPIAVRHDVARPDTEIVAMTRLKIRKGVFEELHRLNRDGVWPFLEKMGARVIGIWREVYPPAEQFERLAGFPPPKQENPDFDEIYMLVRYAGYRHWRATRPEVMALLGGNGPDYHACMAALDRCSSLILESSDEFLKGHLHDGPPSYHPATGERFERVEDLKP